MSLHLMPGEAVVWSTTLRRNTGAWVDDDSTYLTVTTHRVYKTFSLTLGGRSMNEYLPLEKIDSVTQSSTRKQFTKGWIIALVLGLIACVVPGLIVLLIWFLSRDDTLVFTAGGGEMRLDTSRIGGDTYQLELIDVVEESRQALLRQPPPSAPVRVTLNP